MHRSYLRLLRAILFLLPVLIFSRCATVIPVQTTVPTFPSHPLDPVPEKVVIGNAFDVQAKSYRDNKEEQFNLLIEGAMLHAAKQIKEHSRADAEVKRRQVVPIYNDDSVRVFIQSAEATHGMFITSFNAFFEQTHVEVTKTDEGKTREAFYDIIVEMGYSLKSLGGLSFDTLITMRRYHSSRSVLSGLLAAGPSIVSNHDDAQEGVWVNVDQYLKNFFPGAESRTRNVYLTKEFNAVKDALRHAHYDAAFDESEKLTSSADKKISATAFYICAVLAERNKNYESAKIYLVESLNRNDNREVKGMLEDYKNMPVLKQRAN